MVPLFKNILYNNKYMNYTLNDKYKDLTKNQKYDFGLKTIKRSVRDAITTINQRTNELPDVVNETDPEIIKILESLYDIFLDRVKKIENTQVYNEIPKKLLVRRRSTVDMTNQPPLVRRKSTVDMTDQLPLVRRKSIVDMTNKKSWSI
jgi:hypothetical protein